MTKIENLKRQIWDVLDFGCFVSSSCQHFHCNAVRTFIKARTKWHKNQQIEHTPGETSIV